MSKVDFFVQFTRRITITALTFFAILISLTFLSKYIVLYILGRLIDNLKVQRADLMCDVIRKVAPFVLSKL